MDADSLRKLLETAGHAEHADAVVALLQPAVRIVPTRLAGRPAGWRRDDDDVNVDEEAVAEMDSALAAMPLGASRFGGVPDLPPGQAWPERDGVPMEFIAQLRLADVAPHDPSNRVPDSGSLLFFYNSQWTTSDWEPEAACCAVLYHAGADDELVRATPPRVEWESEFSDTPQIAPLIHGMASLAFEPTQLVPGGVSPHIQDDVEEFWQDFTADHGDELWGRDNLHYVLGYVDEQDYVDAHANGTDDQLLLQVDSCDAADMQFGDCNKLFFLMTKAELAARDFSKVRIYSGLG